MNFLEGGPPVLVTQMSIRPNFFSTAATKSRTPSALVTSSARQKISRPAAEPISCAVRSTSAEVRAQMATSQPSFASSAAMARPSPLLAAATIATRPFSPRSMSSVLFQLRVVAKVVVCFVDPIFAAGREEVNVHGVFQGFGFVWNVGGNQEHFAGVDYRGFAVVEEKFQRAGADEGKLFAAMRVARHDAAFCDEDAGERGVFAAHHLAGNVGAELFVF